MSKASEIDDEISGLLEGVEDLLKKEFFKELLAFYKEISDGAYGAFGGKQCCPGKKEAIARLRLQLHGSMIQERISKLYQLMSK